MPDQDSSTLYFRLRDAAALLGEFHGAPDRQAQLAGWVLEALAAVCAREGLEVPGFCVPVRGDVAAEPDLAGCACQQWPRPAAGHGPPYWTHHHACPRARQERAAARVTVEAGAGFAPGELAGQAGKRPQMGWEAVLQVLARQRGYAILRQIPDPDWPGCSVPIVLVYEKGGKHSLYVPNPALPYKDAADSSLKSRGLRRLENGCVGPTGTYFELEEIGAAAEVVEAGAGLSPAEFNRRAHEAGRHPAGCACQGVEVALLDPDPGLTDAQAEADWQAREADR